MSENEIKLYLLPVTKVGFVISCLTDVENNINIDQIINVKSKFCKYLLNVEEFIRNSWTKWNCLKVAFTLINL